MQTLAPQVGRLLIGAGIVLLVAGGLLLYAKPLRLGSLPGDITLAGRNWQVGIWLGTSLVLSIVLTIVLNLLMRRR
jgi:hypothetical protein